MTYFSVNNMCTRRPEYKFKYVQKEDVNFLLFILKISVKNFEKIPIITSD